ncbi:MAG: type IV pili methyl-accepting chemotaxis transducer N-terminal domain-containing protein [Burkholderiaceae bacterium]|nr:type IV pili methyl-accepting chemotaxis transducer N-terminal domain-containing protein [Burkholderiaceae bacterium]
MPASPPPTPAAAHAAQSTAEQDSVLINLAGRQRMLSQRLALQALLLTQGDAQAQALARQVLDEFSAAHRLLSRGGRELPAPSGALHAAFFGPDGADAPVQAYIALGEQLLRSQGPAQAQALRGLLDQASAMLARLHRVTQVCEAQARARAVQAEQRRGELLGQIGAIAGEARVISLNARIVAARAGTSGQEFAVIAARLTQVSEQIERLSSRALTGG